MALFWFCCLLFQSVWSHSYYEFLDSESPVSSVILLPDAEQYRYRADYPSVILDKNIVANKHSSHDRRMPRSAHQASPGENPLDPAHSLQQEQQAALESKNTFIDRRSSLNSRKPPDKIQHSAAGSPFNGSAQSTTMSQANNTQAALGNPLLKTNFGVYVSEDIPLEENTKHTTKPPLIANFSFCLDNNLTQSTCGHKEIPHDYYTEVHLFKNDSESFNKLWIDIESLLASKTTTGHRVFGSANHKLSNSYRRAANHLLRRFAFPFYGQKTRNLTIATGGFVYMGTTQHTMLAATQYIAPLMANFDTSHGSRSNILYVETADFVAVEWREVTLREKPRAGNFTFLVKLNNNGDIYFLYKKIPMPIKDIPIDNHPVKLGVSDAYVMETPISIFNKKVIYEYHRIIVDKDDITNYTAILIKAKPVCISIKNCSTCMSTGEVDQLECMWCRVDEKMSAARRATKYGGTSARTTTSFCSDNYGKHRRRQDWLENSCDKQKPEDVVCTAADVVEDDFDITAADNPNPDSNSQVNGAQAILQPDSTLDTSADGGSGSAPKPATIVGIIFGVAATLCLVSWVVYAYRNPHTTSGQFLIREDHQSNSARLPPDENRPGIDGD